MKKIDFITGIKKIFGYSSKSIHRSEINKEAYRRERKHNLHAFMEACGTFSIPTSKEPKVSIVVALYNSAEFTLPFLQSLAAAVRTIPCEVILVDNASTDLTRQMLERVDGVKVILNEENLHFLRAVNAGSEICRGDYILLLNNDTLIPPDAIGLAVEDMEDRSVGAVGGKLILPDGSLQEAGSIIWNDGSCAGFGRGEDPERPVFQFMRDVDFCSGAFLMVRRDIFEHLGKLDETFAPAYYEEVDLCVRVRNLGLRIVYDPRIKVTHFEFGSALATQQAVDLQIRNRDAFVEKHKNDLERDYLNPSASAIIASNRGARPRMLFIDDRVPYARFGSGFPRAQDMIHSIHRSGFDVTIFPTTFPEIDFAEFWDEYPLAIEVAGRLGHKKLVEFLELRRGYFNVFMSSRPHNMQFLLDALKVVDGYDHVPVIYDAEAIFAERELIRRNVIGKPLGEAAYRDAIDREINLARTASFITAVSERDRRTFETSTGIPSHCIGHKVELRPTSAPFSERRDILFVGSLSGSLEYTPNVDSLVWFIKEIMPIVDKGLGCEWKLLVVGRVDSPELEKLSSDRVVFFGMVPDLAEYFDRARIFIAPTRFAAGVPFKAYEASSHGLPIVSTGLIASQLNFVSGECIVSGNSKDDFAAACINLYSNEGLWTFIRGNALSRVAQDCSAQEFDAAIARMLAEISI